MTFLELATNRFSAREYKEDQIEPAKMNLVLEAGRIAPSAANQQPWHFVVVQQPQTILSLQKCGRLFNAPTYIVICSEPNKAWVRPNDGKNHVDIDLGITIDHLTLAATDLGLGTCWICWFDPQVCSEILELPPGIEPVAILPIGYPAVAPSPNRHLCARKPLDNIVHYETF